MNIKVISTALVMSASVTPVHAFISQEEFETKLCDAFTLHQEQPTSPSVFGYGFPIPNSSEWEHREFAHIHTHPHEGSSFDYHPNYSYSSSCQLQTFKDDNFKLNIQIDESDLSTEAAPGTPLWHRVNATVMCLFSSQYEWTCLFESANFSIQYQHDLTHPQFYPSILDSHIDTEYKTEWQTNLLGRFRNIADSEL